jgi:DNA gyrase subunit A
MAENDNPSIVPVRIAEEMRSSYLDYAMSVIVGRALPDVRDGLKPVHRRILYSMYEQSNVWNRAYRKCGRTVGDVMGKYHPHGDSAIYEALVRMAQPFSMRLPLIDGQGNFGSMDGDPPAAMRYTESRLSRAANDLLQDLDKDTVQFGPNYDGSEHEPLVLPTRLPNLLVNGSEGIAVGMATRIPPHNPAEVLRACIQLIDDPGCEDAAIWALVTGPDFPTGGVIHGTEGIRDAYRTGRGSVRIRAITHIETDERTSKDSIIVTELPYQVNKARLLEKIAELVREKSVEGITDLRDESDRHGMRVVIECRRDANSQVILNHLLKKTALETTFGVNMLAVVAGQPRLLTLREVLEHFLDFRRDVVTRRSLFELREARKRMHILEALRRALDMIDQVIATIRASVDADEAREGLMRLLEIDADQAQSILQMRLQRLTNLEINKLLEEMDQLRALIDRLNTILHDEVELMRVIRGELADLLAVHSEGRRTRIEPALGEMSIEDFIADEQEVVTLTRAGWIKRTRLAEYRTQKRGGKGLKGMETRDEDIVDDVWVTNTHAALLIFTSRGKCYRLKVHELPAGGRNAKGKPIINLIPVEPDEKVQAVLSFTDFAPGRYIITATRRGHIKKSPLVAYRNISAAGLIGVRVPEGDELIGARLCGPTDRILLATRNGRAITFDEQGARAMGRASQGVRGIRLRGDDAVISLVVLPREELLRAGISVRDLPEILTDELDENALDQDVVEETALDGAADADTEDALDDAASLDVTGMMTVLTITDQGYGKRTPIPHYPMKNRGGAGVITIKLTDRKGAVAACRLVSEDQEVILITNGGKIIRTPADGIRVQGRNTQGVRLFSLDEGEKVVGVACFEVDDDDAPDAPAGEAPEEGAEATAPDAGEPPADGAPDADPAAPSDETP